MKTKKTVFFLGLIIISFLSFSCQKGATILKLNGSEEGLPPELKGLKVYQIDTGDGGGIKVAILNGQINSTTYSVGKTTQSCILMNKTTGQVYEVKSIIVENDSIIVARK